MYIHTSRTLTILHFSTPFSPLLYIGPKCHLVKRPRRRDLRLSVGHSVYRRLSTHIHGAIEEVDDAYIIALIV